MFNSSRKALTAFVIAGIAVAGTAAIAQQAAAPAAAPGAERHHGMWGEYHMLPSQMVEARLAFIKTALQITPAQTTQWNAFADFMRKQAKARDAKVTEMRAKMEEMEKGDGKRPDPIERLEHRQKALTEASANMAEFISVAKPLYASFSDSQKEVADEILERRMHGGMGEHHWEGR